MNRLHYPDAGELAAIVEAGVRHVIEARRLAGREGDGYVALDIGPTGRLLKPMGDLDFEEAVSLFGEVVRAGAAAGADLVLIETMNDTLELKAAVLAAKENCDLPVCATCVFDAKAKLLTGGTPESLVAMLEGLRVDALGVNCGMGPAQMLPVVRRLLAASSLPVIVNPNAGLPRVENGRTVYELGPEDFAGAMAEIAALGAHVLGGCCGTTPEYIRREITATRGISLAPPTPKRRTVVSSFSQVVEIGPSLVIVGERINPTGKKKLQQALREHDLDAIVAQGLSQEESGATLGPISGAYRWHDEQGQMLIEESACMGWDGDGPYYLRDGVDVSEAEYAAALAEIPTDIRTLVMYSEFIDPYETLDGRDLLGVLGMEAIAMTYDEAMAALDAEAQGVSSAAAPTEKIPAAATGGGLPESILERQLFCFDGIDGGKGLLFHADGSFTFYEITPGEYNGRLDSVEPVSAHVYRLHVTEADAVPGFEDMGAWYFHAFQPGETFCVAVPGADEGELIGGNLRPDYDEDYMGEGASYDSSCCYIGFGGGDGETIWVPYHVWEQ